MNKKRLSDSIIIGAALFSTLFGAGNMIFPPYLGLESGKAWLWGFGGFYIADVGLAILAIAAIVNKGSFRALTEPIGRPAQILLTVAVALCLGPVISIPRTCATTFELGVLPLFPKTDPTFFSVVFFIITLFLAFNESKVVDIVGKFLTPLLVGGLLFLIVKGVLFPISDELDVIKTPSPIASGISAGYQSMDVLGMAVLDGLIIDSAIRRGHRDTRSKRAVILSACAVASVGLFAIYLGLTYLGATASTVFNMHTSRTELLTGIVSFILPGRWGLILFGTVAGLACLTTSVALTGAVAKYFSELCQKRIGYKGFVVAICSVSCIISMLGVEKIVAVASPLLTVIYPPVLVLILLSYFHKFITPLSYRLAVLGALLYGVADIFFDLGTGFGWLVPCTILAIIGTKCGFLNNKSK